MAEVASPVDPPGLPPTSGGVDGNGIPAVPSVLRTPRMVLRFPRLGDEALIHAARVESWPQLTPWFAKGDVPTMYESAEKVRRDVEDTMARRNLQFYMFEKSDVAEHGEFLGVIGLMRCRHIPQFELGYWLRTTAGGRGFMTEAAEACTRLCFDRFSAVRVEIVVDANNRRSAAVAKRLGYDFEGRRRACDRHHRTGVLIDLDVFVKIAETDPCPPKVAAGPGGATVSAPSGDAAAESTAGCVRPPLSDPWRALSVTYRVGADGALASPGTAATAIPRSVLTPLWQSLICGDASPTRLLGLLSGVPTSVRVLATTPLVGTDDDAPAHIRKIKEPRVRREVLLCSGTGEDAAVLGYAVSWWNDADMAAQLKDRTAPIGATLAADRAEVHREILEAYRGSCPPLAASFSVAEDTQMWGRHYYFWRSAITRDGGGTGDAAGGAGTTESVDGDRPLCMIQEVFSPALSEWLGSPEPR